MKYILSSLLFLTACKFPTDGDYAQKYDAAVNNWARDFGRSNIVKYSCKYARCDVLLENDQLYTLDCTQSSCLVSIGRMK